MKLRPTFGIGDRRHGSSSTYKAKIKKALGVWKLSRKQQLKIDALIGAGWSLRTPRLSDFRARKKSTAMFVTLAGRHFQQSWRDHPSRRYYIVTFADDTGNTSDRTPQLNLGASRRKVDKAIRSMGLNAIVHFETQAIVNYPGQGHGRTLMNHWHALSWTDRPFDPETEMERFRQSRAWRNSLGAEPVHIRQIVHCRNDIERVANYITKLPHDAKNRMPDKKHADGFILMQTIEGYRPELALRILEGLSQIPITDAVFGVGEGAAIRTKWRRRLLAWHARRSRRGKGIVADFDIADLWRALRRVNGSKKYQPYRWLTGADRPKPMPKPRNRPP